jgi:hypothetical protein
VPPLVAVALSGPLRMPRALLVLKDGHVGSEWFAETVSRQPGTRFLFEMGLCITGSLEGKRAFFGRESRGCSCAKEDCVTFRSDIASAPCLDAPSRHSCRVLGGSIMTTTSEGEARQWEAVLRNHTSATVLVHTRSNLVKWAWSFYRTGAMKRLRVSSQPSAVHVPPVHREPIHLRDEANRTGAGRRMHVDPHALLRMVISKQTRAERLHTVARRLASLTSQRRERVLLYEAMQADMTGEIERLYAHMSVPFDAKAHGRVVAGSLLKHAPEDLSRVIANWGEVRRVFEPYPCLHEMLVDTRRQVFDDCGFAGTAERGDPHAPCACSWRTPILDASGEMLTDAKVKQLQLARVVEAPEAQGTLRGISFLHELGDLIGALVLLVGGVRLLVKLLRWHDAGERPTQHNAP